MDITHASTHIPTHAHIHILYWYLSTSRRHARISFTGTIFEGGGFPSHQAGQLARATQLYKPQADGLEPNTKIHKGGSIDLYTIQSLPPSRNVVHVYILLFRYIELKMENLKIIRISRITVIGYNCPWPS